MSNIMRHTPFDVPEPFRRFLQGDLGSWLRVEEYKEGNAMVVRAELPGIDPDRDVDITVSGNTLTIDARREERSEHRGKRDYRSEFRYGSFTRSFDLPQGVNEDDVQASYRDGVLEVRVPVPDQASSSARKVPVSREQTAGTSTGTSTPAAEPPAPPTFNAPPEGAGPSVGTAGL